MKKRVDLLIKIINAGKSGKNEVFVGKIFE